MNERGQGTAGARDGLGLGIAHVPISHLHQSPESGLTDDVLSHLQQLHPLIAQLTTLI